MFHLRFWTCACICVCFCFCSCLLGSDAIEEAYGKIKVYKNEASVEAIVQYVHEHYGFATSSLNQRAATFYQDEQIENPSKSLCGDYDPVDCVTASVKYLVRHMPKPDVGRLSVQYIGENVGLALVARQYFPWASAANVPWSLFLNEVLPYASLTEPRDNWRLTIFRYMREVVEASNVETSRDAILLANAKAWDIVTPRIRFVAAPPNKLNHYSPFEVMRTHNASCTGLSIFLTCALRSIGVPARVAGTPHWNKGKKICPRGDADPLCGNHNWVEAYAGKEWHFVDQAGNEGKLDVGWFFPGPTDTQVSNSRNHSIFASSWANTATLVADTRTSQLYKLNHEFPNFPMVWDWANHDVQGWDVTKWYHWKHNPGSSNLIDNRQWEMKY